MTSMIEIYLKLYVNGRKYFTKLNNKLDRKIKQNIILNYMVINIVS